MNDAQARKKENDSEIVPFEQFLRTIFEFPFFLYIIRINDFLFFLGRWKMEDSKILLKMVQKLFCLNSFFEQFLKFFFFFYT